MIKSAVTVSLVDEARGGPFVFWDGLEDACRNARELGFDAIEIFAPGPDAVREDELKSLLQRYDLSVAAVGTGAGMVKHGLSLSHADADHREKARDFVRTMIGLGATYNAPAIIGSMQGRWDTQTDRSTALHYLGDALEELGDEAAARGTFLIYESLNRYETNLFTRIADAADFIRRLKTDDVKLLADLFHMNIEEADLADAIRAGADVIGHVHFVDSNRQAAGRGHMDFGPIAAALAESGFDGYASAEAFPLPDPRTAAAQTIETFKTYFPR